MNLDETNLTKLAEKVSKKSSDKLAKAFVELLDVEFSSRHHSRPRIMQKLTEIIDDMEG